MAANRIENASIVELGELIEICDTRNTDKKYGIDDVCGMTIEKEIIPTKADVKDTDLSKFYIVQPQEFVYNPRTHGRKIGLGFNNSNKPILISWNNTAFKVKEANRVIPTYLYMIFTRDEWDREACFNSWGSSTVVFAWEDFCKMKIPLPSIKTQRKLAAVYRGLKELAEENEKLLEPLSKSCQAFIADCKKKYPMKRLGDCIEENKERNAELTYDVGFLRGVTSAGKFDESKANTDGLDFSNYKIVSKNNFAYNPSRINVGSIALNTEEKCIVSPMYIVFKIKGRELLPEYLKLWFSRKEFQRSTLFYAMGSVRDTFDFYLMKEVKIPLPPIEIQQKITDLYNCYEECKRIATQAREKIKNICPALVQKAVHIK